MNLKFLIGILILIPNFFCLVKLEVCENVIVIYTLDTEEEYDVDIWAYDVSTGNKWKYIESILPFSGQGIWIIDENSFSNPNINIFRLDAYFTEYLDDKFEMYFDLKYYSTTKAKLTGQILIDGEPHPGDYMLQQSENHGEWTIFRFGTRFVGNYPMVRIVIEVDRNDPSSFFYLDSIISTVCDLTPTDPSPTTSTTNDPTTDTTPHRTSTSPPKTTIMSSEYTTISTTVKHPQIPEDEQIQGYLDSLLLIIISFFVVLSFTIIFIVYLYGRRRKRPKEDKAVNQSRSETSLESRSNSRRSSFTSISEIRIPRPNIAKI